MLAYLADVVTVLPLRKHLPCLHAAVASFHILDQNEGRTKELVLGNSVNLDLNQLLVGLLLDGHHLFEFLIITVETGHVLVEALLILLNRLLLVGLVLVANHLKLNVVLPSQESFRHPDADFLGNSAFGELAECSQS